MKTFRDNRNHVWEICVNIATIRRVKDVLNADLLDIDKTFFRLMSDPIFLADVLFVLCQKQAESIGIDDITFRETLAGDVIGSAKVALLEELRDFFPSREEREAVTLATQRGAELLTALRKRGLTLLTQFDVELEATRLIDGVVSMNSPELSESIPDRSPSAN